MTTTGGFTFTSTMFSGDASINNHTNESDEEYYETARSSAAASKLLASRDFLGAKRFAERSDIDLPDEHAEQILAIADVLLSSTINNHHDWYSLLRLSHPQNPNNSSSNVVNGEEDDDFSDSLKRNYRNLTLLLHPNRNRYPGADSAFNLVLQAYSVLSDPNKKSLFDAELIQISHKINNNNNNGDDADDDDGFWTMCSSCCHVHMFHRAHLGSSLRCPTCRRPFEAVEMLVPPDIVPGTNTYNSSWAFFPLGFPTSVNSKWNPFVPMFPWTATGGGGGTPEPKQPAKRPVGRPPKSASEQSSNTPTVNKGVKRMARKSVGGGAKKRGFTASEPAPLNSRAAEGGSNNVLNVGAEKETVTVTAKGIIDMNEKAKDSEEAGDVDGFEMLIDMDVTNDLLGNLQNLPFLREENTYPHSLAP